MMLLLDDLSDWGRARVEDDYQGVERRDGGKTSRADFALGWMAAMSRPKQWQNFTPEARGRIEQPK